MAAGVGIGCYGHPRSSSSSSGGSTAKVVDVCRVTPLSL